MGDEITRFGWLFPQTLGEDQKQKDLQAPARQNCLIFPRTFVKMVFPRTRILAKWVLTKTTEKPNLTWKNEIKRFSWLVFTNINIYNRTILCLCCAFMWPWNYLQNTKSVFKCHFYASTRNNIFVDLLTRIIDDKCFKIIFPTCLNVLIFENFLDWITTLLFFYVGYITATLCWHSLAATFSWRSLHAVIIRH